MITISKNHYLLIQWIKWNEGSLQIVEGKRWGILEGLDRMAELKLLDNTLCRTPLYSFIKDKYSSLI